jgi:hypothetical protein
MTRAWGQTGNHRQRVGINVIEEVRFAPDSPLEGDGFELSVPRELGYEPTKSEKQASQETTVSDNSDAKVRWLGGVQACMAIARLMTSKSARLPRVIDPMPAAGATSARLTQVRAL